VTNISKHGLWLLVLDQEIFLPFEDYPWFKDRSVAAIVNVVEPSPGHFFWPDIDVDLDMDIIQHPGRFPLVAAIVP
jgi:hypothetical protein